MKSPTKKGTSTVFTLIQTKFNAIVIIKMPKFDIHHLEESQMPKTATSNKKELMAYFTRMTLMRRTEIFADKLYMARLIRSFYHLHEGQEAITEGMEGALTYDDAIVTAYRDHCQKITRGNTPYRVIAGIMQMRFAQLVSPMIAKVRLVHFIFITYFNNLDEL